MPDSPLVALLNGPGVEIEPALHVLAGDFEGDGLLAWLGDCLSEAFYGGQTDLVVNTPSMSGGAARRLGIWQKPLTGPEVSHFSYFRRDESALPLLGRWQETTRTSSRLPAHPGRHQPRRAQTHCQGRCAHRVRAAGHHGQPHRDRQRSHLVRSDQPDRGRDGQAHGQCAGGHDDGWIDRNYQKLAQYLAIPTKCAPLSMTGACPLWRLRRSLVPPGQGHAGCRAARQACAHRRAFHGRPGRAARTQGPLGKFQSDAGQPLAAARHAQRGSHSMAAVLLGRDDFVQMIARWFDLKHNMREFLGIVRDFPGVLELLPWPGENGLAIDGVDYFGAQTWQDWSVQDPAATQGKGWQPPQPVPLDAAREACRRSPKPRSTRPVRCMSRAMRQPRSGFGSMTSRWRSAPLTKAMAGCHGEQASRPACAPGTPRRRTATWPIRNPPSPPIWNSSIREAPACCRRIRRGTWRFHRHLPSACARGHTLYPSAEEVLSAATGGPGRSASVSARRHRP